MPILLAEKLRAREVKHFTCTPVAELRFSSRMLDLLTDMHSTCFDMHTGDSPKWKLFIKKN